MELRAALACVATLLLARGCAGLCPATCVCSTTPDGLHKATCSDVRDLAAFLADRKHHNINILDLSHNNITRLDKELDNLDELVALDLSTNGFTSVGNFLRKANKLVHLNLANNRIASLNFSELPKKLSSLDLSDNVLRHVPSDIKSLPNLEHIQLEGNPIECSCQDILIRDYLLLNSISIDNVRCRGCWSWLEVRTKYVCGNVPAFSKIQPGDYSGVPANQITDDIHMLKHKHSRALSDLDEGMTWFADSNGKDYEHEDEVVFLRAKRQENESLIEGSGNDAYDAVTEYGTSSQQPEKDNGIEGSGEGSGFGVGSLTEPDNDIEESEEPEVTTKGGELYTDSVAPYLGVPMDNDKSDDEIPEIDSPTVFKGNWSKNDITESKDTDKTQTEQSKDETKSDGKSAVEAPSSAAGAEKIQIDTESERVAETQSENKPIVQKTGTYICIAIIVVLLVSLIAFAVVKGQVRKRRDRRLQRQQPRDVEKASKEMVDMNTSLLGKPAPRNGTDKKSNGKYELVPTHDPRPKKSENGNVGSADDEHGPPNGDHHKEDKQKSADARDSGRQTASSSDSKKENGSLSSEDIFVPASEDSERKGVSSDLTRPTSNGRADSELLSPSKYDPVYSGRVRIKMTETPKPKTPVLVTRSRSDAGELVVTPAPGRALPAPADT